MLQRGTWKLPSSDARERIGAEKSNRLSLALPPPLFSSAARKLGFPYNPRVRERLEYAAAWLLLKTIGAMPRSLARFTAARTAALLFWMRPGLRAAATENLKLAFPAWSKKQRR